jgi:hypothetical protein
MKQISFVISIIVLVVILFSMLKYASDESIFENMSQGRFAIIASIINDESPGTSDTEKINMLKNLDIKDPKIKVIMNTDSTNAEKIKRIKEVIRVVTL